MSFPIRNWDKMATEQKDEIRVKAAELLNNLDGLQFQTYCKENMSVLL